MRELTTRSPAETEALAASLAAGASRGLVIGLRGDLGAGKTCFVRGLARGLGIDPDLVHSPTFIMMTEYPGGRLPLHHIDLYRLEARAAHDPAVHEVIGGNGVAAVEWFDFLPRETLGDDVIVVQLAHGSGDERVIRIEAEGERAARLLAALPH